MSFLAEKNAHMHFNEHLKMVMQFFIYFLDCNTDSQISEFIAGNFASYSSCWNCTFYVFHTYTCNICDVCVYTEM